MTKTVVHTSCDNCGLVDDPFVWNLRHGSPSGWRMNQDKPKSLIGNDVVIDACSRECAEALNAKYAVAIEEVAAS